MGKDFAKHINALIIDDQVLVQGYLKFSLQELGFERITYADQTDKAIEQIRTQEFDLILCSYDLKREQEGLHLYQRLIEHRLLSPATAFVFISADTSAELVHSIVELQPDDFLVKPFTVKQLEKRLRKVLSHKRALRDIYKLIELDEYDKALAQTEAFLTEPAHAEHYPAALRLKGELLIHCERFEDARDFYQAIINIQNFAWAQLGLIEALLKLGQEDEAEKRLLRLALKPDAQLRAFDMLADIKIKQEDFDMALESTLLASEISPRNIQRHHKAMNLSRLTHDYATQFDVAKKIVRYARHSVHDEPEMYLNVARAGVDYAMASDDEQTTVLLAQSTDYLRRFRKQFPKVHMDDQINVISARILYLQNEKDKAKALIEQINDDALHTDSMDTLLDKAKAFHELGMFEKSLHVMNEIENRAQSQPEEGQIFLRYIQQEKSERESIRQTPKALNNSAVSFYQRGELDKALSAFRQAFRIMPKSPSIALNLLQTIVVKGKESAVTGNAREVMERCIYTIENSDLNDEQTERYNRIRGYLQELL